MKRCTIAQKVVYKCDVVGIKISAKQPWPLVFANTAIIGIIFLYNKIFFDLLRYNASRSILPSFRNYFDGAIFNRSDLTLQT